MWKRLARLVFWFVTAVVVLLAIGSGWLWMTLRGSLPQVTGEVRAPGLAAAVTIDRDGLGIPTLRAKNRTDLAFATGFVHAQERFFQMDLLRRSAAGELAELFGPGPNQELVDLDRQARVHRFRDLARRVADAADAREREIVEAYVAGVNAGLTSLASKPFEYVLLRVDPQPWTREDTVLVSCAMWLDLQRSQPPVESVRGLIRDVFPQPLADFLLPPGSEWDAPLGGPAFDVPPVPGPEVCDVRAKPADDNAACAPISDPQAAVPHHAWAPSIAGSNNWALSGLRSKHGGAIVANDMHLGIQVPNIWYRAQFVWRDSPEAPTESTVTGATLPGTPVMVVGSNTHVAWGFTNSEGDWCDLVIVEPDPNDPDQYLTPDGPRPFEKDKEIIHVHGADDVELEVVSTIWGPIFDHDHRGRPRTLHWAAHDPAAVNFGIVRLESAKGLEDALTLANRAGSPAQNFVVADDQGRIAWTILGRIPRRVGFNGLTPVSWADGTRRWDGWLSPDEYPRIVNPEGGQLWTANARTLGGDMLQVVGDGGYDLGARARQIRDDLTKIDQATEQDMLAIALDDRAAFLEHWQKLLVEVLGKAPTDARRSEARKLVEDWGGRASIDSVGFRLVSEFQMETNRKSLAPLAARLRQADPSFDMRELRNRGEGPVWRLVTERPLHLLDPQFKDWDELLLSACDAVLDQATCNGARLADYTWGSFNTTPIQHPLSVAVPQLGRWLDMPRLPLPGASGDMPLVQGPSWGTPGQSWGASERMAVSPGRESEGYFHMPCGQCGHPLSPHYADGHAAWAEGRVTPFLPGSAVESLTLTP